VTQRALSSILLLYVKSCLSRVTMKDEIMSQLPLWQMLASVNRRGWR